MKKIALLLLCVCLLFVFCSCSANTDPTVPTGTNAPTDPTKTSAEPTQTSGDPAPKDPDPETAMDNFVKKLEAANYVVDVENYLKTSVVSPGQVTFTHNEQSSSINFAFVTVNGETFEGELYDNALSEVVYLSAGSAVDALGEVLPNYWIAASEGNMWDLFYNNVDDPLEFISYDEMVKKTVLGLGGYSEQVLSYAEEVHVRLDAEDPTAVRFTAHINQPENRMIHYDDLDITLRFGEAVSDARVEKWLSDPIYPPTRTGWTVMDRGMLDNVFLKGYGETAVPFPSFASYALVFDDSAYTERTEVFITDAHATEKDVEDYKAALLDAGYEAVDETLPDGSSATVYRMLLRPEKNAYAELYPYYDGGFALRGGMYYEAPEYDGLEQINGVLVENGFAAFDPTDVFTGWKAVDEAVPRSESWAYFFNYELYMPFILEYEDADAAEAYFESYGAKLLENGFVSQYAPGADSVQYSTPNGFTLFRYTFGEDGVVMLEFKSEKSLTADEVNKLISEHGLPEAGVHGDIGARDLTTYYYNIAEFKGVRLLVYQPFASSAEAEAFLDAYVAVLDEQGYYYVNPQTAGSNRTFLYLNEELGKYVGFDYFPGDNGATVTLEFVSIEPEEEDILGLALGH